MEIWRQIGDIRYELHARDALEGVFPRHESLITLWRDRCGGRALPGWSAFAFEDFRGWWGWIAVGELLDTPEGCIRFRLWGTRVAAISGVEWTGRVLPDPEPPRHDAPHDTSHHTTHGTPQEGTGPDPSPMAALGLGLPAFTDGYLDALTTRRAVGLVSGPLTRADIDQDRADFLLLPLASDGERVDTYLCGLALH
ncbi:hypothetical protein KAJ83_17450 [Marivibrio halodurans]|uniref:Uncharacterized protein n=1 Tax=Marivibrio halodurans TaxID=2039722 RepID=A0A8J7S5C1_9PROT|nr:hypothetical protein [Marivibrio halodurans]MBP5858808.1 hypothetical protein [Marivibrio halodurans]